MDELGSILDRWRGLQGECATGADAHDAVLATVVHVRGSAYRRPGARMLILDDGTRIGTISGGCLETDVARKAWWWTDDGASIRVFDNSTEDAARDFGLGCNGVITVLLERLRTGPAQESLTFLDARRRRREAAVVATVIGTSPGADLAVGDRLFQEASGATHGKRLAVAGELDAALRATWTERRSRLVHLSDADVFVEWVGPPQRLFLFGAGHDVAPLSTMASMMGWNVTVADIHASQLQPTRFPAAHRLFAIPPGNDISALGIGSEDAVVVMTHNYPLDASLLPQLLEARPRYLGLLGPRVRAEKMFAEIGANFPVAGVHAPIGLDIGGERPESIALAVVAEIQAVLHGHLGGHLSRRSGAIHEPALELGTPPPPWNPEHTIQPTCELAHA